MLTTDPYQIVKSGSRTIGGRRITFREVLLGLQIAICAVLVTSSLVAVRGLVRSLGSNFGFQPSNTMLMETVLSMVGYRGDAVPAMQRRIIDATKKLPCVISVGLTNCPPLTNLSWPGTNIFRNEATDLRPSNAVAAPLAISVSPEYFQAAGTASLSGRTFTWHDDEKAPRVAVVNQEFALKLFGSVRNAVGAHYKMPDGTRIEVVGVVENGKYKALAEDPQLAMFFPTLQAESSDAWFVVRSNRAPGGLANALRKTLRNLDAGLPLHVQTWTRNWISLYFPRAWQRFR